jgi:hypothetical protein
LYKSRSPEQQASPSLSAPAKAVEAPFIDHRTWPEPALVPYRAVVVFSDNHGEVAMEYYVRRTIMLPTHAIGAIYDGDDPAAHTEPVHVVPSGELRDGGREHLKQHTHLLRAWTRDWDYFHYVKDCDVGVSGVVANVMNLQFSMSRGNEHCTDVASITPCGIALEDGRAFQTAAWWEHFLEHGNHYANNWDYLLHSARKEFKK